MRMVPPSFGYYYHSYGRGFHLHVLETSRPQNAADFAQGLHKQRKSHSLVKEKRAFHLKFLHA